MKLRLFKKYSLIIFPMALLAIGGIILKSPDSHQLQTHNSSDIKNLISRLKPSSTHTDLVSDPKLTPGSAQTQDLPVVHVSGTLTQDQTWSAGNVYVIDNTVDVPSGVTLTLEPGVIVKYPGINQAIAIAQGATLSAQGNSTDPIIFTSSTDDSVGGDTDGYGPSTGTAGDYETALLAGGGNISMSHAIFRYGNNAIRADYNGCTHTGIISISDSNITASLSPDRCVSSLILQRNIFDVDEGPTAAAIYVSGIANVSTIELSGANKNSFSGSSPRIQINNSILPAGSSWTSSSTNVLSVSDLKVDGTMNVGQNVVLYVSSQGINVNGILDIDSGAIVKFQGNGTISSRPGGMIDAQGDSSSPIVFTSYRDDTVGGDTDGYGPSTGTAGDYETALLAGGGNISMSHVLFNYGNNSMRSDYSGCTNSGNIDISDSNINSTLSPDYCVKTLILERNIFDIANRTTAIYASYLANVTTIDLSGPNENKFVGEGNQIDLQNSTVPSDTNWNVDEGSGAVPYLVSVTINGIATIGSGVIVRTGYNGAVVAGTLNFLSGSVVKSDGSGTAISVTGNGTLSASGTSLSPFIMTSYADDTIGGDTNKNGASSGQTGDYGMAIEAAAGSTTNISHAEILYGATALISYGHTTINNLRISHAVSAIGVDGGDAMLTGISIDDVQYGINVNRADVVFRGIFNNVTGLGIQACDWGSQDCSVDASYSDWGSAAGPNTASKALVCGQVTVAPWKSASSTIDGGLYTSKNCGSGSSTPTPDQQLSSAASNFSSHMSSKGIDCGNGFQDACAAMETAQHCLGAAVQLAGSQSPFPLPNSSPSDQATGWANSASDGASTFVKGIEGETPFTLALDFGNGLIGALNTLLSLSQAYNTCAP